MPDRIKRDSGSLSLIVFLLNKRANGYKNYCSSLISFGIASVQWIDGSYTTNKSAPKDIDLVVHFDGMQLHDDADLP
jgi:hypothetical protein